MNKRFKDWLFQNIANGITIFGLILSVWLLIIILISPEKNWLIFTIAGFVGLSDFLDGKIARWLNIKSFIGGALDRLRDKIFICPTLILIVFYYWEETSQSSIWFTITATLVIVVSLIEFLLLFSWFFAIFKKFDVCSNQYGRIKMMLEFIVVILWLFFIAARQTWGASIPYIIISLIDIILLVIIYYAIKSLDCYYKRYTIK